MNFSAQLSPLTDLFSHGVEPFGKEQARFKVCTRKAYSNNTAAILH